MAQHQNSRKTPDGRVAGAKATVERLAGEGEISEADADAILEFEAAFDAENAAVDLPHDLYPNGRKTSHKTPGTRAAWLQRLHYAARELELTAVDGGDINEWTTAKVKSGEWKAKTAASYEETLKKFYRYHEFGPDPREITTHEYGEPGWDHRDMLTPEERHALTVDAPDHPRDRAIVNLLIYTGMRNTALRMCRVKDIDLDSGDYYFNNTAEGLKDLYKPRSPRPLLEAEDAVRDWLSFHPDPQPDNYLITGKPAYSKVDPTEPVSDKTIARTMRELTKKAFDVEKASEFPKPTHPHMMRHNYVTRLKRELERPDDEIKFLIAHAPASTVMQSTYSHLSASDYGDSVREAAGLKTQGDGPERIAPEVCPCGAPQERPMAVSCWKCGTAFTPEAKSAQQSVHQDIGAAKALSAGEVSDEALEEIAQNDELLAKLIELRSG